MRTPGRRRLALRDVMRHGELVPADEAIALATHARNCAVFGEVVGALRSGTDSVPLDLGEIRAPVLLAWAQHDRVLPMATCSSRYRREIPGAEWRVLPDVGHVPMWDDPGLIARTIAGWALREAELPQPGIA
jgi:pimeloyl-ACP methyl ester carboxylesterase